MGRRKRRQAGRAPQAATPAGRPAVAAPGRPAADPPRPRKWLLALAILLLAAWIVFLIVMGLSAGVAPGR